MVEHLSTLCETVADNDEIEILVLSGGGEVFCRGLEYPHNLKGIDAARAIRAEFGDLRCVESLAALTKPTIAVVNGDAP